MWELIEQFNGPLQLIASIVASLTIVLTAYEKWWVKPRTLAKEKERSEIVEIVKEIVDPINAFVEESQKDRRQLNKEVDSVKREVEHIGKRVYVIEEGLGISTVVKYKEVY